MNWLIILPNLKQYFVNFLFVILILELKTIYSTKLINRQYFLRRVLRTYTKLRLLLAMISYKLLCMSVCNNKEKITQLLYIQFHMFISLSFFLAPIQDKCLKDLLKIPLNNEYLFHNYFVCWSYSSLFSYLSYLGQSYKVSQNNIV